MRWICAWAILIGISGEAIGETTLIVAADGSGKFKTVQEAIDAVAKNNTEPVTIRIKPGTYKQQLRVPRDKTHVTFLGEDAKTTILTNDLSAKSKGPGDKEVGTSGSSSTFIDGSDF